MHLRAVCTPFPKRYARRSVSGNSELRARGSLRSSCRPVPLFARATPPLPRVPYPSSASLAHVPCFVHKEAAHAHMSAYRTQPNFSRVTEDDETMRAGGWPAGALDAAAGGGGTSTSAYYPPPSPPNIPTAACLDLFVMIRAAFACLSRVAHHNLPSHANISRCGHTDLPGGRARDH